MAEKTYRISSMSYEMRVNIIDCLSQFIREATCISVESRHLRRYELALRSLVDEEECITFTQCETILMTLSSIRGNYAAEEFRKFIEESRKLDVLLSLGD